MLKDKFNFIYILYCVLIIILIFIAINFGSYNKNANLHSRLLKTSFNDLPEWKNSFKYEIKKAFINTCLAINKENFKDKKSSLLLNITAYKEFCSKLILLKNKEQLRKLIEIYFDPYLLKDADAKFTGYIELTVKGRKVKDIEAAPFSIPILKKPKNLITIDLSLFGNNYKKIQLKGILKNNKIIPFPSRKEIETSKMFNDDILAYIDDPAEAFFLHIQGSGRIIMPNGETMFVGYSDNNGKKYKSVGKILLKEGEIDKEDISMQSIKNWMKNNTKKAEKIRHLNERYIFFKERDNEDVFGSSKVKLEAMHSIAVDNRYISFHTPIWAEINSFGNEGSIYSGLFLAHDTGAAIKGPLRFDLFMGHEKDKEEIAGSLNSKGTAWLLLPKESFR